jgi:hypothetical protein
MAIRTVNHIPFHKRPKPAYLIWIRDDSRTGPDVKTLENYDGYRHLHTWQNGMCAMCGRDGDRLVLDHCHETGLARGFLCSPCNLKESKSFDVAEWNIYRKFPPAVLLGLKFYYNDFGQAPYPAEHLFTREQVDSGIEKWENAACYELVKLFCNYRANLDWVNLSDMRLLVRKSLAHVRDVSGVEVLSENEKAHHDIASAMERILNPQKIEEAEEVLDKSISAEEKFIRTDRYFNIDEYDRDVLDKLTLALIDATGIKIEPQDMLEALVVSQTAILPIPENWTPSKNKKK